MSSISLTFPDSTYTSSNKPSVTTLKSDLSSVETGHNDLQDNAILKAGTVAFTGDQSLGSNKIISLADGTTDNDAVNYSQLKALYPVGSIYINATNATNPGTLLGFGTWTAFGAGKMMVGFDSGDTDFDTAEETGGAKTATLAETNLPAHTHTVDPPSTATDSQGAHTHNVEGSVSGGSGGTRIDANTSGTVDSTSSNGAHTHSVDIAEFNSGSVGSDTAFSIMNPYITVYMWKRTV